MRRLAPLILLVFVAPPVGAQTGRQALADGTARYLLADYQPALPLLSVGLDPGPGLHDELWLRGVERLVDVLLVLRQDSLAATWLRWAIRLAPELQVNEDIMPPAVVRAAQAARAFVDSTPHDRFVARTGFEWLTAYRADAPGTIRLTAANIPIAARIGRDQFLRAGESRRLPAGSYPVVASAPGYLPTRLTVEVLPGVTSVVEVGLLPETAGLLYVAARPWGVLFVDGQRIGYTAVAAHRVIAGDHTLRLQQNDGQTTDTSIVIAEREEARLSWVKARDVTGDARVDNALAALDGADPERAVLLLRQWLLSQPALIRGPAAATALARLAEATWSLGDRDSTRTYLRELVLVDPFYWPPQDLFNPELQAAYAAIRRQTPAIALRAPRDTVITPFRDVLPVEVAVGQPGEVRLLLRLTHPRPRDSLLTTLTVDSTATARISLSAPDSAVLAPGTYAIEGEVAYAGGGVSDLLQVTIDRLPVDTAPYQPPILAFAFRPEIRKGRPSLGTVMESVALGGLAVLVPAVMSDGALSGRSIPLAAGLIGGSVAIANLSLNTTRLPIPDNVAYNQSLRTQRDSQNRRIAAENAIKMRHTPLRIRTTREP